MTKRQAGAAALFYDSSIERHVRSDHLLGRLDAALGLPWLRAELDPFGNSTGQLPRRLPPRSARPQRGLIPNRWRTSMISVRPRSRARPSCGGKRGTPARLRRRHALSPGGAFSEQRIQEAWGNTEAATGSIDAHEPVEVAPDTRASFEARRPTTCGAQDRFLFGGLADGDRSAMRPCLVGSGCERFVQAPLPSRSMERGRSGPTCSRMCWSTSTPTTCRCTARTSSSSAAASTSVGPPWPTGQAKPSQDPGRCHRAARAGRPGHLC